MSEVGSRRVEGLKFAVTCHIGFPVGSQLRISPTVLKKGLESRIEGVGDRRVEGSKCAVKSRCGVTAADFTDVDYMGVRVDPEESFEMCLC